MIHWADGGETKLTNIVSLCGFHHRLVHEGGYGVTTAGDHMFVFTRPDGQRITDCGRPSAAVAERRSGVHGAAGAPVDDVSGAGTANGTDEGFSGNADAPLRDYLAAANSELAIDAATARCKWAGERMDYSMAVESMQWRDRPPKPARGFS